MATCGQAKPEAEQSEMTSKNRARLLSLFCWALFVGGVFIGKAVHVEAWWIYVPLSIVAGVGISLIPEWATR